MKKFLLPLVGLMTVAATGCGGGGGSAAAPSVAANTGAPVVGYPAAPPPGTTTTPSSASTAVFKIKVPHAAATATTSSRTRRPQYVSTATQSIQIAMTSLNSTAYSATAPVIANLTPGSLNCTTDADGASLDCTVGFPSLPVGTDGFTLTTYDGMNASGDPLSTNTTTGIITVGTTTDIPVVLEGIIRSTRATIATSNLTPGTPVSGDIVTITAYDAAGAQIIGSAPYENGPIAVTAEQDYGAYVDAFTGMTNLTKPSDVESVNYDGTAIFGSYGADIAVNVSGTGTTRTYFNFADAQAHVSTVGTPIDFSPVAINQGGSNAISVTAGSDSSVVVQLSELGWGNVFHSNVPHPWVVSNSCPSLITVTPIPNSDQFTVTTSSGTAVGCVVRWDGGALQHEDLDYALTGTTNGGNFEISSIHSKR